MNSATQQAPTPETPTTQPMPGTIEHLLAKSQVAAQPFTSDIPILGPLIVWFRHAWNSISTRWYVAPLLRQQNEFNVLVVGELHRLATEQQRLATEQQLTRMELAAQVGELKGQLDEVSERLIASDRDATTLALDLGRLTYAVLSYTDGLATLDGPRPQRDKQTPEQSCD